MSQQFTLFIFLFLWSLNFSFAQNGRVSGTIRTSDGKPAELVTITIKSTNKGSMTDKTGNYTIKDVTPGSYTLKVTSVGLEKQEKAIEVSPGSSLNVDFVLKENAATLQEVLVSTKNLNKKDTYSARMPLKKLENPQVYSTVSVETMKEQGLTNFDDALRNVPGITRTWESTGRASDGASYFALRGFDSQPIMYNGLPGLTNGNLDPINIEEIQVIKGPSATLFGGSFYSYGGMINTITKKPYYEFGGEVTYQMGSYGLNRVTADINTPLSKTEKIALRINTAYHDENSFQDAGSKKSFFLAPSLVYEVNDRLSFHLMAEILEEERAVPAVFFHSDRTGPLPFKSLEELNLNNNLSFISNDLTIKNPRFNLQGQMLYKLSEQWTSQTAISRGTVKSDGYYTYIWDDGVRDNYFDQFAQKEQQTTSVTNIQQNFNGDFKIGALRNRLLVGLNYFNRNTINNGSGSAIVRKVTPQQAEVAYIAPGTTDTIPPVYLSRMFVDRILANTGAAASNVTNSSYSAYVSDVLNITPALSAMASLRIDHFVSKGEKSDPEDDFNQTALSPKFGLVYQPILDKVSIFANYMNAFINVAPRSIANTDGSDPRIKSFKPEQANQFEYGIKTDLFNERLNTTISVYNIKVSDRVSTDPNNRNDYLQGGKVQSKGFEIELNANPFQGLNLIAGYSYNKTEVIAGDENDFYSEPGRAIGGQGPQNLANLWVSYRFTSGKLQHLGLGFGGNYAGKYRVMDSSITGEFDLPSYILLNAGVFYNLAHYRISFNLNNITNKEYYIGYWSVNPQRLRNFSASFSYKF